ncbi:MAG: ATP-dependent helicase [Cytophagales bacterium]
MQPKNWQLEFDKCNPAQKAAIDTIEGPVLVIAGPGTGKTQILSLRIGKILLETDAKPHNILCLTYTDAGTIAMRQRLEQFIGTDAYKVHIHTFHSFCNKVIQENMEYFSLRELQLLTDLERIELMTELIDSFPPDHFLKKYTGDIYSSLDRMTALFSTMKSENWSANDISKAIDEYLTLLPEREGFFYKRDNAPKSIKKGDPKTKEVEEETARMENLRAAANEFQNYEALMRQHFRYDYQDMINWVIKAFEEHETLLAKYQEQYLYFLVDEFQDTNGSQSTILHQLIAFFDNPNVFVVGDDDQSIYRFQGANLKNILDFVNKYEQSLAVVMLKDNYRSTQNVLDASKAVISNNEERITNHENLKERFEGLDKNLISQNPSLKDLDIPISIVEYQSELHEEADIVKQIENLYQSGQNLAEVAILYRNHKQIANILQVFDHRKIPYNAKKRQNLFDIPFAQNLIIILKYIEEETIKPGSGNYLLFQLMHFEFFNISPRDVAAISVASQKKDEPLLWREIMGSKERMFKLNLETAGAISSLEANLNFWTKEHFNYTIQVFFEKILTRGGIFHYIINHEDKIWLLEIVNAFFEFIKDETAKNPTLTLTKLLEMIVLMRKNRIEIPIHKIIKAENGINLITAHSSKGLEFQYVFLIAANEKNWEKKIGNSFNYKLPDTLTLSVAENKVEEERRLFYVAITRAKKHLQVSYSAADLKDKEKLKSLFISEILNAGAAELREKKVSEADLMAFTAEKLIGRPKLDAQLIETNFLVEKLKNLKLSVTHVNKYLHCPLTYYFENVLQVPTARSPSMGFGNAIHYALEQLFKQMKASENEQFPSKEAFYFYFKKGLENYQSHFTEKEFKDKLEYAQKILPEYYDFYINKWHRKVAIEYRPANITVDNIPLTGALDKIEFYDNNEVHVVDYKTGKADNIKKKLVRPKADADPVNDKFEEIYGGDYWRQIVFYKILLENDKTKNWNMTSGEVDFVEKRDAKDYTKERIVVSFEDFEIVKKQITQVYNGIMVYNFAGCGKEDCQWCNFVKNNYKSEVAEAEET